MRHLLDSVRAWVGDQNGGFGRPIHILIEIFDVEKLVNQKLSHFLCNTKHNQSFIGVTFERTKTFFSRTPVER